MKTCLFLIFCSISLPAVVFAQNKVSILDDAGTNPGMIIDELRPKPSEIIGSFYVTDQWLPGNVYLSQKLFLKNYPLRFDLKNNLLEIKVGEIIKVCPLSKLERFDWKSTTGDTLHFLNSEKDAMARQFSITGVLEVLETGKATLWASYQTEVLQPTYVTGIDVGRKETKIDKKIVYFLAVNNQLCQLSANKAKNEQCLGSQVEAMLNYAKQNRLKFTRRDDLVQMVHYFNKAQ